MQPQIELATKGLGRPLFREVPDEDLRGDQSLANGKLHDV
jgi:hypothetical protein